MRCIESINDLPKDVKAEVASYTAGNHAMYFVDAESLEVRVVTEASLIAVDRSGRLFVYQMHQIEALRVDRYSDKSIVNVFPYHRDPIVAEFRFTEEYQDETAFVESVQNCFFLRTGRKLVSTWVVYTCDAANRIDWD